MIKVNLGCGNHSTDGWINFDNSPNLLLSKIPFLRFILWKSGILSDKHYHVQWIKGTRFRNLKESLPFKSQTVDYVYTSHFLEHLSFEDSFKFLQECHRILVLHGLIRIVIPDLQFYIQKYCLEKTNKELNKDASDRFMKSLNILTKSRDPHLWMYDFDSIASKLIQVGFKKVIQREYQRGECPDIEVLDYIPTESLWIEATK